VRQPVEEAGRHQQVVVRRHGAQHVEHGVRRHQRQQQPAARPLGAEEREDRGAHDDADRVRRDEVPGRGDRDAYAVRDLRQQAHRHELGGADREAAHGERQHGEHEVAGGGPGVGGGRGGCGRRHAVGLPGRGVGRMDG
jgi:hypothetical protein